jgi:radical SAM protein with 4Fe4S-binding SPASM domain
MGRMKHILTTGIEVGWNMIRWYNLKFPSKYPPTIVVEPVNACNLKCTMCAYSFEAKSKPRSVEYMDLGLLRKVVDEAKGKCRKMHFSSIGEPMLHPELHSMIAYAKTHGFWVRLTTNGTLFTPDKIEKILDAKPDLLRISVDGANAEVYEEIRKGARFDKVLQNLSLLRERRDKKGVPVKITVHAVLMASNLHQIGEFKHRFARYADEVTVMYGITWGFDEHFQSCVPMRAPQACSMTWTYLTVQSNGLICFCCNDYKEKSAIGDLNRQSIKEVWNSRAYRELRKQHLKKEYDKIELCKNCRMPSKSDQYMLQNFYDTLEVEKAHNVSAPGIPLELPEILTAVGPR